MKLKTMVMTIWCLLAASLVLVQAAPQQQQPAGARGGRGAAQEPAPPPQPSQAKEVTVTGIPGVIAAGATWRLVWQGADNADGIVGTSDGGLLFAQEQPSIIRKLDRNDWDSVYVKDTHGTGAIAIDAEGRIIGVQRTCTDPGRAPLPCTEPTKVAIIYPEKDRKVLAENINGSPALRLNDLTVSRNGTVYFNGGGMTFYLQPGGKPVSVGENAGSNGIMLSPDEKTLYMTNMGGLIRFDIQPDGTPTNRRDFVKFEGGGGDGMTVDSVGRIYVTASGGVQVMSPEGKHLGTIPTPRSVITVAFSGPDKKTLYVVGSGAVAPNGGEFALAPGYRNNAKTIYKIPTIAQGLKGRAK